MALLTQQILQQRQAQPLDIKVIMTQERIRAFYEHFNGDVYVSFSGGKDSLVLLDIVRSIYLMFQQSSLTLVWNSQRYGAS